MLFRHMRLLFIQAINLFNVFGQTSMCVFSTFDFTIMWIIVIIRMIGRPDISLVAYILNKMHTSLYLDISLNV